MTLSSGDRFSGELSITKGGTGSVSYKKETISVGPVICEEGEQVQLKYLGKRKVNGALLNYAICLSNHAVDKDEYNEYLDQIIDLLTPDGPPDVGSETYVKVIEISKNGIGYASPGGQRIELGPVDAREGDFVQVVGVSETHARVVDQDVRGPDYETRFSILIGDYDSIPIDVDDEYTCAIAEFDGDTRICYVKNIPIYLAGCEGKIGQKLDVRISDFGDGKVLGEVLELHDDVSRIKNPGHWARMQWLREAGFDEPTFKRIVSDFIGVSIDQLPEDPDQLEAALIGEAIRLCLANKAKESSDDYPRAHITGIRHWVAHKLEPILDRLDADGTGWFREYLDEGNGPTLSFLGDVIKLSHGYYASGSTRAVFTDDTTAVLISGVPTREFFKADLEVQFRGLTRIIPNTCESELQSHGITVLEQNAYTSEQIGAYDETFLTEFINSRELTAWQGGTEWEAYGGKAGFGWAWRDVPIEVKDANDRLVSLWRKPIEYGGDEYYLQIDDGSTTSEVHVPYRYHKHMCLLIDAVAGTPRTVYLSPMSDSTDVHLATSFGPPKAQFRWLTAIGSEWRGFANDRVNWVIPADAVDSVKTNSKSCPYRSMTAGS